MDSIDRIDQGTYFAKPDRSATIQEGKIEAIGGKLYLSGNLDLTRLVTEKCPSIHLGALSE